MFPCNDMLKQGNVTVYVYTYPTSAVSTTCGYDINGWMNIYGIYSTQMAMVVPDHL